MFNITIIQSYYEDPLPQVVLLSEGLWADFPGQHPPLLGWGPGWWTSSGQWWDFHHHHIGLWREHWSLQYKILILYFALKNQRCLFALVPHYCSFGIWLLGLKMFHRMHLQWPHPARIWRVPANGLNLFHHHHHHDHHHHHHQNHSHYHPNVFIFLIVATTITFIATTHIHIHHRCTIIIWSRHFKKPPGKVWCLVLCRQFKLLLLLVQVFDRILLGNIMILVFRWLGG